MNVTSKTTPAYQLTEAAERAAEQVGVCLYNLRDSGRRIAFTLKTGAPSEWREDWRGRRKLMPRYQRQSQWERHSTAKGHEGEVFYPTVPGAVCWHGYRDFLRAFYARVPDAKVRTSFTTYQNAAHFEATYRATYDGPEREGIGFASGYRPYEDACTCDEGRA
jgi:hypothetical protein